MFTRQHPASALRGWLLAWLAACLLLALAGCETTPGLDTPSVKVVGVEPLPSQGLEVRFAVRLRVQNPNATAIDFDGVAVELELNGKSLASGVSDAKGSVPRFGETLISVPVSISAFAAFRQALGLSDAAQRGELPFVVRGKLAGGAFGSVRFSDSGTLRLPQP
jgi:LEA14-like dessication related protein